MRQPSLIRTNRPELMARYLRVYGRGDTLITLPFLRDKAQSVRDEMRRLALKRVGWVRQGYLGMLYGVLKATIWRCSRYNGVVSAPSGGVGWKGGWRGRNVS